MVTGDAGGLDSDMTPWARISCSWGTWAPSLHPGDTLPSPGPRPSHPLRLGVPWGLPAAPHSLQSKGRGSRARVMVGERLSPMPVQPLPPAPPSHGPGHPGFTALDVRDRGQASCLLAMTSKCRSHNSACGEGPAAGTCSSSPLPAPQGPASGHRLREASPTLPALADRLRHARCLGQRDPHKVVLPSALPGSFWPP